MFQFDHFIRLGSNVVSLSFPNAPNYYKQKIKLFLFKFYLTNTSLVSLKLEIL